MSFVTGFEKVAAKASPSLWKRTTELAGGLVPAMGAAVKGIPVAIGKARHAINAPERYLRKAWRAGQSVPRLTERGLPASGRINPVSGKEMPKRGANLAKGQTKKMEINAKREAKGKEKRPMIHDVKGVTDTPLSKKTTKKLLQEADVEKIKKRHAKVKDAEKGPSWAMRHPFVTAGAGLYAGKTIFGDKGQESPPQERMIYPQQGY